MCHRKITVPQSRSGWAVVLPLSSAALPLPHLQCDSFSSSELLLPLSPSRSESRRSSTYLARLAARRWGSARPAAGREAAAAAQQHAWHLSVWHHAGTM